MKKVFVMIMIGLLAVSMTACGQAAQSSASRTTTAAVQTTAAEQTTAAATEDVKVGGYTDAASPVVPEEVKALFDKAAEGLTGVGYVPVAYIGSQVVAGTNHLLLCEATPATEDGKTTYALVTLYEDLNGGAQITDVQNCEAEAPVAEDEPMDGAVTAAESPEVTAEAKEALTKATESLDGATYAPVALLSTQVVNGTNYTMLCKITAVTAEASTHYTVVTVYANSDGTAEISGNYDFTAAQS